MSSSDIDTDPGSGDDTIPNLEHTFAAPAVMPAEFRLVPGFEMLCLFLIAAAVGDPDGLYDGDFFPSQSWQHEPGEHLKRMGETIDFAGPLAQFLRTFLHDSRDLSDLLMWAVDFSDRSVARPDAFRTLSTYFIDCYFLEKVVRWSAKVPTFDYAGSLLHDLFSESGGCPGQYWVFCDHLPASGAILDAIRMFPGREHVPRGSGECRSRLREMFNECSDTNHYFITAAIGTIGGRMTLALFHATKFYLISDRNTAAYDKFTEINKLDSMRLYMLMYTCTSFVQFRLVDSVMKSSDMTFDQTAHVPVRDFVRTRMVKWSSDWLSFRDLLIEAVQFPAFFAANTRLPGLSDAPQDYAFALEVVCTRTQNWRDSAEPGKFARRFASYLKVDPVAFIANLTALFTAYGVFTNFVYRLIQFLQALAEKNAERTRTAFYQLFPFLPFHTPGVFRVIITFLTQVPKYGLIHKGYVGEALAVVIDRTSFDSSELGTLGTPAQFTEWSMRLPSHIFQAERANPRLTISEAVRRLKDSLLGALFVELDEIFNRPRPFDPKISALFADWSKQTSVDPAIRV
jgi:hypothetical protein